MPLSTAGSASSGSKSTHSHKSHKHGRRSSNKSVARSTASRQDRGGGYESSSTSKTSRSGSSSKGYRSSNQSSTGSMRSSNTSLSSGYRGDLVGRKQQMQGPREVRMPNGQDAPLEYIDDDGETWELRRIDEVDEEDGEPAAHLYSYSDCFDVEGLPPSDYFTSGRSKYERPPEYVGLGRSDSGPAAGAALRRPGTTIDGSSSGTSTDNKPNYRQENDRRDFDQYPARRQATSYPSDDEDDIEPDDSISQIGSTMSVRLTQEQLRSLSMDPKDSRYRREDAVSRRDARPPSSTISASQTQNRGDYAERIGSGRVNRDDRPDAYEGYGSDGYYGKDYGSDRTDQRTYRRQKEPSVYSEARKYSTVDRAPRGTR